MDTSYTRPTPSLERLPSVLARIGMKRAWLYKQIAEGAFPPPVKIGGASCWDARVVDRWIEEQLQRGSGSH